VEAVDGEVVEVTLFLWLCYLTIGFGVGVRVCVAFIRDDEGDEDMGLYVAASLIGLIAGLAWPLTALVTACALCARHFIENEDEWTEVRR
jgi:hypothetical protein